MNSRLEALKQQIEQAFADVPYPGDGKIGSDPDYWESAEINDHFRGRHWKDIPRDLLQYHQHDLPFFSAAGLHYYFPTYMFAALEDFVDIPQFAVFAVDPNEGELRDYWFGRFDSFTPAQKNAVRSWLEYLRDEMPGATSVEHVNEALNKYWGRDWK